MFYLRAQDLWYDRPISLLALITFCSLVFQVSCTNVTAVVTLAKGNEESDELYESFSSVPLSKFRLVWYACTPSSTLGL